MTGPSHWRMLWLLFWSLAGLAAPVQGNATTVRLPITLDYPLLQSLIIQQAYRDPGQRAQVLDLADGCSQITLSNPRISHANGLIRFQSAVDLSAGTPVGDYCIAPLAWSGDVVLWQQPAVNAQWQLGFTTVDSALWDRNGEPAKVADLLWRLVKTHVHSYLDAVTIDLAPPVADLKTFLLPLFTPDRQADARRMLASMVPAPPRITPDNIQVDIVAQITPSSPGSPPSSPPISPIDQTPEASASAPELAKVIRLWETWDAVLIHMVTQLSGEPLRTEDQHLLLDTLLAVRHDFSARLAEGRLTNDFVRGQFIDAWQDLNPIFRFHLSDDPNKSILGYLGFFTAADALKALDQVGPSIGIEISRDGFLRLAHILSDQPLDQLVNPDAANSRLREVLGLEPSLPPAPGGPEAPAEAERPQSWWRNIIRKEIWFGWWTGSRAWAAPAPQSGIEQLRHWTAEINNGPKFVNRVAKVITASAYQAGTQAKLESKRRKWFDLMALATAWQESCFRQFSVRKGKITYLLSYNKTSVGLMQINERVWSGIYDRHKLRWDIHYNAVAGCEILTLYLQRYILKRGDTANLPGRQGGKNHQRFLAGWLYALYNGGPRQLNRYPERHAQKALYRSDQLLLAKYDLVTAGDWMAKVDCLPRR